MESVEPSVFLSPCSSGGTMVDLGHADYGLDRLPQPNTTSVQPNTQREAQPNITGAQTDAPGAQSDFQPQELYSNEYLKIVLPNLVDHISVAKAELDAFVAETTPNVSIMHVLIYLFAKKVHPQIHHINNIKLLHVGRMYHVGKTQHFWVPTPLVRDIIEMFPTFQLLICPDEDLVGPPLEMPICQMLQFCSTSTRNTDLVSPPATYAEAMVRMFRARRRSRKNSVDTLDSNQSRATRFLSRGSTTDTEEGSGSVTSLKIKRSFKKIIQKTRVLGLSPQYGICLDHRL